MHFGTLDAFVESASPDLMLGKKVANFEFLKALLRYGSFDEYHFFLPTISTRLNLQTIIRKTGIEDRILKRLKFYSFLDLQEKLMENDYQVFHQGDFMTYFSSLCFIRNRFAKRKFPITGVTHSLSYRENTLKYYEILSSGSIQPYDSIICTSSGGKRVLEQIFNLIRQQIDLTSGYRGRFDCIPLGIDTEMFTQRDKEGCRKKLGLPLDKLIILGVTRFSVYSKMDLYPLLQAFKMVLESLKVKNVFLVLAGADKLNYVSLLEDFSSKLGIREFIQFKVNFSDDEKPLLYSAADIFVSPSDSFQETFGLSVVEAMASGLPAVVSDFNGYKDLVEHQINGFRVPTYWADCTDQISELNTILFRDIYHLYYSQSIVVDVNMMSKFLLDLINNLNLRARLGENARKSAEEKFSWRVIIRRYEGTWKSLYDLAQNTEGNRGEIKDPFQLRYYDIFRHYTTAEPDKDWEIRISDFGLDVLHKRFVFPIYPDMANLVRVEIAVYIMTLAEHGFIRIGDVIRLCTEKWGVTKQKIMYQIMWMLKQNFLDVHSYQNRVG
ncbi:MAG: glycosyltransferase family 4 protein [Deltaproteobacteria bacterium]|nr:glycosyltransferase family 4 protein [Deltaproteobacteria bacterium]MBW2018918.1 glycosyltransferase family 4 protein [Deltaproteobacteria bacterium]MBW2073133.1 glycosyltransferase family 4 protein [Deltaproteobacteria bacterium]